MSDSPPKKGRLVIVSGPSGAGKTTICDALLEKSGFARVITCTTRPRRGEEQNGRDYHFMDREEFEEKQRAGAFLETAEVYGNLYGTPRDQVTAAIERGEQLLLNIDVQGARTLREELAKEGIDEKTEIFVEAPSIEELELRLSSRGTESPEELERRLRVARKELAERAHYEHVVVNDNVDRAVDEIVQILRQPAQVK